MECAQVSKENCEMVTCEMEAAEALACLAQCSAVRGGDALASGEFERISPSGNYQGQLITGQSYCGYKNKQTSYKSNFVSKLRPKLTEAEKEARKIRRILANRESARQTIRLRQAMYMDLTRKAADLSEENKNLKREKELAVKEYEYLKDRNDFLKAQMAKIEKVDKGERMHEDSTNPVLPHNQPSFVPFIWPSIFPYTDFRQTIFENSSQFSTPEIPLVLVPVPLLLPIVPHNSDTNEKRNVHQPTTCPSSVTQLNDDKNIRLSSNRKTRAEGYNCTKYHNIRDFDFVSGFESMRNRPLHKSKPEDILVAVEARRRRKELMKLKVTN